MKKSILILASITIITSLTLTSCSTSSEKVENAEQAVIDADNDLDKAKKDYTEEYNKFKLESDEKITANEKLIADLKEYSKNKKKEAKIEYEKSIDNLEVMNNVMKEKINDYQDEGNDQWQSFKDEFNHDMLELGQAINDLNIKNVK